MSLAALALGVGVAVLLEPDTVAAVAGIGGVAGKEAVMPSVENKWAAGDRMDAVDSHSSAVAAHTAADDNKIAHTVG